MALQAGDWTPPLVVAACRWDDVKEEVGSFLKQWYRNTHGVNSASNAEDMSVILEAYWLLAAKR